MSSDKNETDPLLSEGTSVEFGPKGLKIRRLKPRDLFKISEVLADLFSMGGEVLQNRLLGMAMNMDQENLFNRSQQESLMTIVMLGFPHCEEKIMQLMASFLETTVEELDTNPDYGMDCFPRFLNALTAQPDFASFFVQIRVMVLQLIAVASALGVTVEETTPSVPA